MDSGIRFKDYIHGRRGVRVHGVLPFLLLAPLGLADHAWSRFSLSLCRIGEAGEKPYRMDP